MSRMSKSYERFTRLLEHFQDQGCFAQASFAVFDRQGVRARGDCGGNPLWTSEEAAAE